MHHRSGGKRDYPARVELAAWFLALKAWQANVGLIVGMMLLLLLRAVWTCVRHMWHLLCWVVGLLGGGYLAGYKSAALAISPQQLQFENQRAKNSYL